MRRSYLTKKINAKGKTPNIFANTSGLLLSKILLGQFEDLSINQLANENGISIGLVHKIVSQLVEEGYVRSEGVRTAKKYKLIKPKELLKKWISSYNITERCRFYTYNIGIDSKEVIKKIKGSKYKNSLALALHSACLEFNKFTNLDTNEFYLLKEDSRKEIEQFLRLEPVDRGYQVLLIEPYYSRILEDQASITPKSKVLVSPPLLTFLDLYHFPLRGIEQAEFLLKKHIELKKLSALFPN